MGGIRTVEDVRRILLAGADKVSINSAAVRNPDLLSECAERFGSQCVVLAVDARRVNPLEGSPRWEVVIHGGAYTYWQGCAGVGGGRGATRCGVKSS